MIRSLDLAIEGNYRILILKCAESCIRVSNASVRLEMEDPNRTHHITLFVGRSTPHDYFITRNVAGQSFAPNLWPCRLPTIQSIYQTAPVRPPLIESDQ